ncbi:MAG: DUF1501 domain-containing protein [Planctomycetes bacterium]|nr:DUF1501 domain-containing protein [Planctomycetota bacterium]
MPHSWRRRQFLLTGMSGVLGLSLPRLLAAQAQTTGRAARARNVLVILEQGGLSHIDTWDPKPDVVAEHRSPHRPISTSVPGMQLSALLPRTARLAHKIAVVRSMHHSKPGANGHPDGTQYVLSGSHPRGPLEMPDIGSITTHLLGTTCPFLPPYIMVPGNHEQAAETRNGFLPASTRVFKTGGQDLANPGWRVNNLLPYSDNTGPRFHQRRWLLANVDAGYARPVGGMERFYEQAGDILGSPRVASVFNLGNEPQPVRDLYGRGHRGACYLMGRKLIEAGVRFVTVDVRWPFTPDLPGGFDLNWDHHDYIYTSGSCGTERIAAGGEGRYGIGHWVMMGSTDHAFAGLIEDLDQRGLLNETLVCFVTEFGRTPRLNRFQGRDHWTDAYSIVFAGAGVPGGQVIGRSDRDGGYVADQPHTPEDYAATIYEKLGIDRQRPIHTSSHRPVYFGHGGEPIRQVL